MRLCCAVRGVRCGRLEISSASCGVMVFGVWKHHVAEMCCYIAAAVKQGGWRIYCDSRLVGMFAFVGGSGWSCNDRKSVPPYAVGTLLHRSNRL